LALLCKGLLGDLPATGGEVAKEITAYRTGVVQRAHEKMAATKYGRTVQLAHQEWREHNATGVRILMDGTTPPSCAAGDGTSSFALCPGSVLMLKGRTAGVRAAAFSVDGSRIVTGREDATARVWDARTGAELLAHKGHTSVVWSTSFSADGSGIITGRGDSTAMVWDARPVGRVTLVGSA
jgi:hypothetical protein